MRVRRLCGDLGLLAGSEIDEIVAAPSSGGW